MSENDIKVNFEVIRNGCPTQYNIAIPAEVVTVNDTWVSEFDSEIARSRTAGFVSATFLSIHKTFEANEAEARMRQLSARRRTASKEANKRITAGSSGRAESEQGVRAKTQPKMKVRRGESVDPITGPATRKRKRETAASESLHEFRNREHVRIMLCGEDDQQVPIWFDRSRPLHHALALFADRTEQPVGTLRLLYYEAEVIGDVTADEVCFLGF